MDEPNKPKISKWVVFLGLLLLSAAVFASLIYKVGHYGP